MQGAVVWACPTGGVRGGGPSGDPGGGGLVVRRVLRGGRVEAVTVRVEEAVADHLAIFGHLLVGGPFDPLDGILVDLFRAHLYLLARGLAEDLGVEYALFVDPLADDYVAVGIVLELHIQGAPARSEERRVGKESGR